MSTGDFVLRPPALMNFCTKCGCYFGHPGSCNCFAPTLAHHRIDPTRFCPCRPENGGSGICGCSRGTIVITGLSQP